MSRFRSRQRALRASLEKAKLSAGLLTDSNDVFYYTGFKPTAPAFLLLTQSSCRLFVYGVDNAASALKTVEPVFIEKLTPALLPRGRVGFDQTTLTAADYLKLRTAKLVPALGALCQPRMVKDSAELSAIRKAIRIAHRAHDATKLTGTERDVARSFDARLRAAGAEPSFDTIIASGSHSGDIHHVPTSQRIRMPVVFDFGARANGYCSDVTRMHFDRADRGQRELVRTVSRMQSELIDALEPGMAWKDVQQHWERLMSKAHAKVQHGFGHGIGLAVHEPLPTLVPGSVFTVEPGIYKSTVGCRIEDIVLMTRSGPRVLSRKA